MLYEVITPSGNTHIAYANNSKEAKKKVCNSLHIQSSDYWAGVRAMRARKINEDYPETFYRPLMTDEVLEQLSGKDVVLYDEHHGSSIRVRKATAESISYFMNEYTTIIML